MMLLLPEKNKLSSSRMKPTTKFLHMMLEKDHQCSQKKRRLLVKTPLLEVQNQLLPGQEGESAHELNMLYK
jgi:hypothetical protein